jgi:photosystem II stability/assembly factor-like uncharacterized protein
MGDAFRDDLEAAQQRADALEQERNELQKKVAGLEDELSHKREEARREASPARPVGLPVHLGRVAATCAVLGVFAWFLSRWLGPPRVFNTINEPAATLPPPRPQVQTSTLEIHWSNFGAVKDTVFALAPDPGQDAPWLFGKRGTVWTGGDSSMFLAGMPIDTGVHADLLGGVAIDEKHVVGVGRGGAIIATDDGGHTWHQPSSGTTMDLYAVAASDDLGIFAVGAHGTVLHSIADGVWRAEKVKTTRDLYAVAVDGGAVIAAGARGTVLVRGSAGAWQTAQTFTSDDLHVAYANGTGGVWVAGDGGTLLVDNKPAGDWRRFPWRDLKENIRGLTSYMQRPLVVTDAGNVWTLDLGSGATHEHLSDSRLVGIASANSNVYAVSAAGELFKGSL